MMSYELPSGGRLQSSNKDILGMFLAYLASFSDESVSDFAARQPRAFVAIIS